MGRIPSAHEFDKKAALWIQLFRCSYKRATCPLTKKFQTILRGQSFRLSKAKSNPKPRAKRTFDSLEGKLKAVCNAANSKLREANKSALERWARQAALNQNANFVERCKRMNIDVYECPKWAIVMAAWKRQPEHVMELKIQLDPRWWGRVNSLSHRIKTGVSIVGMGGTKTRSEMQLDRRFARLINQWQTKFKLLNWRNDAIRIHQANTKVSHQPVGIPGRQMRFDW